MTYKGYSTGELGAIGIATSWKPGSGTGTPTTPVPTTLTTGGTVIPGTYGVEVTGVNANGESLASPNGPIIVPAGTNTNTISVPSPTGLVGATGWYAYVTQAGGSAFTRQQVAGTPTAIGTALTITAPPTTIGAAPPVSDGSAGNPLAVATPTTFVMAETIALDSVPTMVTHEVYGSTRDSDRGYRTGKYKVGGPITYSLYPTNGLSLLVDAIGTNVYSTALTADIASVTTNGNVSTLVLTTGGSYNPGDIVIVDAAALQEPRPVLSYNAGTKTMVVPALFNTHAGTGVAVQKLAQILINPYNSTTGYANLLRRCSLEENVGGKYAYSYPGGQVSKWDLKASTTKMDVTADIVCDAQRILKSVPTAFNADTSWNELSYEFTDGFLAFPNDPGDSGSSTTQLVGDGESWDLSIDNGMIMKAPYDGTAAEKNYPGMRKVTVKFQVMSTASRPVMWTDFLTQNLDMPFFSFAALNVGGLQTPQWQAMCFYFPTCRLIKSTEVRSLKDVVAESVEIEARAANGLEKLYVSACAPAITTAL